MDFRSVSAGAAHTNADHDHIWAEAGWVAMEANGQRDSRLHLDPGGLPYGPKGAILQYILVDWSSYSVDATRGCCRPGLGLEQNIFKQTVRLRQQAARS